MHLKFRIRFMGMVQANDRQCCNVTSSLIDWTHAQCNPCSQKHFTSDMLLVISPHILQSHLLQFLQVSVIKFWLRISINCMVFCQLRFNIYERCDMAFIEPMHRNKTNITYLFQGQLHDAATSSMEKKTLTGLSKYITYFKGEMYL